MPYVLCFECNQAMERAEVERLGRCPNPACRPGMYADGLRFKAWEQACNEARSAETARAESRGYSVANFDHVMPMLVPSEAPQPTLWHFVDW